MVSDGPDGAILHIKVVPRAGKTMVAGSRDGAILIRLAAAPVDGAANTELIALLSNLLDVPKRQLVLVSGDTSRTKRVKALGLSSATVRERLRL